MLPPRNSKLSAPAVEIARALLNECINKCDLEQKFGFALDAGVEERYRARMRFYRLAIILMLLQSEERKHSGFSAVRDHLEARALPSSRDEGVPFVLALQAAIKDVQQLVSLETHKNSGEVVRWARSWLAGIGIAEENVVTLTRFAIYWTDYYMTATDAIREFDPKA